MIFSQVPVAQFFFSYHRFFSRHLDTAGIVLHQGLAFGVALDSAASFKARLVELNLPQPHIDAFNFEARRVNTFANFAFISPYQLNSGDEAPLVDALKDILRSELGDFLPTYRRLFSMRLILWQSKT